MYSGSESKEESERKVAATDALFRIREIGRRWSEWILRNSLTERNKQTDTHTQIWAFQNHFHSNLSFFLKKTSRLSKSARVSKRMRGRFSGNFGMLRFDFGAQTFESAQNFGYSPLFPIESERQQTTVIILLKEMKYTHTEPDWSKIYTITKTTTTITTTSTATTSPLPHCHHAPQHSHHRHHHHHHLKSTGTTLATITATTRQQLMMLQRR